MIRRILPPQRPLIINCHLFHANFATRLAFAMLDEDTARRVHVVSTVHVVERRFRPWQFAADRMTARYARAEVCVSRHVREFHQKRTGLPGEFFRVIENGIDLAKFTPSNDKTRRADAAPRVVSIGRLDRQKDYPTLLKAWQRVIAVSPGAELLIAGTGPERASLEKLSRSLKLTNVRFLGFEKDTPGLLRGATLYVQSSAWEGMPLTIAEAMACGLPIVATEVGGVGEMIRNGVTGVLVRAGNPEQLARETIRLLRDPRGGNRLGAAAHVEAQSRFSVERMVAEYAALFREIIAR